MPGRISLARWRKPSGVLTLHPRLRHPAPSAQRGILGTPLAGAAGQRLRELQAAPLQGLQGLMARKTALGGALLATPIRAFGAADILATPNAINGQTQRSCLQLP